MLRFLTAPVLALCFLTAHVHNGITQVRDRLFQSIGVGHAWINLSLDLATVKHTFDRTMLVAGLIATVCADFVAKIFFGQSAIFSFTTSTLALRYYWLLALLGILLGLAGAGYNFVMLKILSCLFTFIINGLCCGVLDRRQVL